MEIDGKMRKTSETTESVGNNRKCRKQQKASETTENVGKQQKMSEMSELELVEIWYMTPHKEDEQSSRCDASRAISMFYLLLPLLTSFIITKS